jgi:RNA polymerase sigma-B factor
VTPLGARVAPRTRGLEPRVEALIAGYRRTGDRTLRERAVRQSMPLARRLALRFHSGREPLEDLVQVANVGLVKAVDRFDPELGNRFSSFAVPTIAGELRRHFRSSAWNLHVPRSVQEAFLLVREASDRIGQRSGRPPTVSELSAATGLDPERILEALQARAAQELLSLDQPSSSGGEGDETAALSELVGADDERLARVEERVTLAARLRTLPERERRIVQLRFVHDLTQSEIAARMGCSQMQISRLLRRAVASLAGG